jgi:hypothetical protein
VMYPLSSGNLEMFDWKVVAVSSRGSVSRLLVVVFHLDGCFICKAATESKRWVWKSRYCVCVSLPCYAYVAPGCAMSSTYIF